MDALESVYVELFERQRGRRQPHPAMARP
jgi:hypothetical protein